MHGIRQSFLLFLPSPHNGTPTPDSHFDQTECKLGYNLVSRILTTCFRATVDPAAPVALAKRCPPRFKTNQI